MQELKAQGKTLPDPYPYPVQVWRLGADQLWIALGGEVVVDYALSLKAKYGPSTWVFGYSNDVMAYIPSSRVWKEGGYESGVQRVRHSPPALVPRHRDADQGRGRQLVDRSKSGP